MTARIQRVEVSSRAEKPAFERKFQSELPSEEEIANNFLRNDWQQVKDRNEPEIARTMQMNAVALAQAANTISVNRGLSAIDSIGGDVSPFLQLVSQSAFSLDARLGALVEGAAKSIVDEVVVTGIGSIPFVGNAAAGIIRGVQLAVEIINREEVRPGLFRMEPENDDAETARALQHIEQKHDWTGIFLPRGAHAFAGDESEALPGSSNIGAWQEDWRDGAFQFTRLPQDGPRFGCAPGDLFFVDDMVQSRVTAADIADPGKGKHSAAKVISKGDNLRLMHDRVFSTGQWLPSLSALARATWSMIGDPASTSMFNVDAMKLAEEWQGFEDNMVAWRRFLRQTYLVGKEFYPPRMGEVDRRNSIAWGLSRLAAAQHDRIGVTGPSTLLTNMTLVRSGAGKTVGKESVKHAGALLKRQKAAMRTRMNAVVSKNSAALVGNKALRSEFFRERTALLDAGKFDTITLSDVPDEALRERITARVGPSGGGVLVGEFADPVMLERARQDRREAAASIRSTVPKAPGFNELGEVEDNTGTGSSLSLGVFGAVAATAAAGAAGYALHRRRARK